LERALLLHVLLLLVLAWMGVMLVWLLVLDRFCRDWIQEKAQTFFLPLHTQGLKTDQIQTSPIVNGERLSLPKLVIPAVKESLLFSVKKKENTSKKLDVLP
jgi:hypothetical protein